MLKDVVGITRSPRGHWVGDGFPVRSLFSYDKFGARLGPFLLLDYAGPVEFAPTTNPRGVGEHPHRGFETVTLVYSGDSAEFTRLGGALEMAQLWVNLPAQHKMSAPRYQTIVAATIPRVALADGIGQVRVVAGIFASQKGPALTFSELNVWDVRVSAGHCVTLPVSEGHTTALAVFKGSLTVNGSHRVGHAELVIFERAGSAIGLAAGAGEDAVFLLLSGVPIDEPIVGHGPFVMNSLQEIETAINDFNASRFGRMPARARSDNEVVGF